MCMMLGAASFVIPEGSSRKTYFKTIKDEFPIERGSDGAIIIAFPSPSFGAVVEDREHVSRVLGGTSLANYPVRVVATGKPKIIVPIKNLEALLSLNPDPNAVVELSRAVGAEGLYVWTRETIDPEASFHARHWNPISLSSEDPICGNGSGALAAYLHREQLLERPNFTVGMPGLVIVKHREPIRVGGYAHQFGSLEIAQTWEAA